MWVCTGARKQLLLATVLLLPICYQARPKPVSRITKTSFPSAKSTRHSFNTEVIVDSSISRTWTPHAIFLSDRNDPLWECWYNLSNLTNQRVYQELVYRNGSFKEMITGSAAPALPVSSHFIFLFALSQFSGPDYLGAWNRLRKVKGSSLSEWGSSFLKTMPSEIGFLITLTSGAFLNQNPIKKKQQWITEESW